MSNVILETARGFQPVPLTDMMLKKREVFLMGEVTPESCASIMQQLIYLDSEDPGKEITLYINSPGGSVSDGLAVYDLINLLHSPVRTVCLGVCASMGAVLFLSGRKREIMEHGKIMIHDPSFGWHHDIGGLKPDEIQAELNDLKKCRDILTGIISERTGKTARAVKKVTVNDAYFYEIFEIWCFYFRTFSI